LTMSKILLIAGAVFVVAAIVFGFSAIASFFSKRSSKLGTNTSVLALGVLVILVIANVIGYQHHKFFDLTTEKLYTLSDQTKKIVGGLKNDVNVVRFAKTPDSHFDEIMTEYRTLNSHIHFQNVDPQEKPEVAKDYGATHIGDVIVSMGAKKQTIPPNPEAPVSEYDITSALLKITQDKVKTVCFVTGHGEK